MDVSFNINMSGVYSTIYCSAKNFLLNKISLKS